MLAQKAQALFQPHVKDALALLERLLGNSESQDAKDNVFAALCRIAHFQYLPVPADQRPQEFDGIVTPLFGSIPFDGDEQENLTVLKFAIELN